MRLRRIEAVRFGALEDVSVGDFSDTLTVVHGPNEAGKSTLVALVRAVLYGFATKSAKEAYLPAAGARRARLIFEEGSSRWVIERTEGKNRGPVTVRSLDGDERPGLLEELTRGVDESAYGIVFGFGLGEMGRIAEEARKKEGIAAALYAASAGVRVSPDEIRKELDERRAQLFVPRGSTQEVSRLIKALDAARRRLREARDAAERYSEDRRALDALDEEHERLRAEVDEAQDRVQRLTGDLERASSAVARAKELAGTAEELAEDLAKRRAEAAAITVDHAVLEAADAIDALAHQREAVAQAVRDLERLRERARSEAEEFERVCSAAGLDLERVRTIAVEGPIAGVVEAARDDIARLESEVAARRRELERAEAEAERARNEAGKALAPVGLPASASRADLDAMLAEIDASEEAAGGGNRGDWVLKALMTVLGAFIFVLGGVMLGETVSLVAGPVIAALGAAALIRDLRQRNMAGAGRQEVFRRRRLLEAARGAVERAESAREAAERARLDAESAAALLASRTALLARELEASGLPSGLDARGAAAALDAIRRAQRHDAEARNALAEAQRLAAVVERFVERVGSLAGAVAFERTVETFDDAASTLSVLVDRLAEARSRAEQVRAIESAAAQVEVRLAEVSRQKEDAEAQARSVLDEYESAHASVEGLRTLLDEAMRKLAATSERLEQVTAERSALKERLASFASDEEAAQARLDEAGIVQRLRDVVEEHATLSLAIVLLDRAQRRYQEERQPEVLRHAERVFRTITQGRYERVIVPLGGGRVEVWDGTGGAKESARLSMATAEALYLALRLGLVGCLKDVGPGLPMLIDDVLANFDPERMDGAIEAIAELSASRQVVFFTCHDDVAERLVAAGPPGTARLELPVRR
ncbi:MAG: AAA family ATPase [Coriobacteriia bacterium]|nr:AAA family ATPase [Coriobacteriia bacterium]